MEKRMDTAFFDKALKFAIDAHSGFERRGKGFPYIIHPLEVATIVATMTADQELLAAALLHDVVEDTQITVEDIKREFGDKVAKIVANESDITVPGKTETESWHQRKQAAIDRIRALDNDSKIVALGDKLSNMRLIAADYKIKGDGLWNIFHVKDRKDHEWHYRGLADSLRSLDYTEAYREFERLVNEVFGEK